MTRPKLKFPRPLLHKRGNAYRIRWYAYEQFFEFSLGPVTQDHANHFLVAFAAALARNDDYPEEAIHEPAVKRFIALASNADPKITEDALIDKYIAHLNATLTSQWPRRVRYFLTKAQKEIGTLQTASTPQLSEFLDSVAVSISPASRNRAQISLSGFYRWLRLAGHLPKNYDPMEGISQVREPPNMNGIVMWEKAEVKRLLNAADQRRDGIAVWIAILAGLRRGEIARLRWEDVTDTCILVQKSKTGEKRQIPLSKALEVRLAKEKRTNGTVVPWPENTHGWEIAARRLVKTYLPAILPTIAKKHPEKFGWNPFRHTFASRLAQSGLSLDIIAAWLGDSPKVCKEHYARYVSKKMRDKRIDLVDP